MAFSPPDTDEIIQPAQSSWTPPANDDIVQAAPAGPSANDVVQQQLSGQQFSQPLTPQQIRAVNVHPEMSPIDNLISPVTVQKVADKVISKLPEKLQPAAKAIAAPTVAVDKTIAGIADWMTSPSGAEQLAAFEIPVTRIPTAAKFFYDMAKGGGQNLSGVVDAWKSGDKQALADSLVGAIASFGGAAALGLHTASPLAKSKILDAADNHEQIVFGATLKTPAGATPPMVDELTDVTPGVPTQGIPFKGVPDPRLPKNKPVVPGTAAEPYETALQTIRKANAVTVAQIQNLFPKAGLSREAARDLRNQAWGKPQQQEGTQNASSQPSATVATQSEVRAPVGEATPLRQQGKVAPAPPQQKIAQEPPATARPSAETGVSGDEVKPVLQPALLVNGKPIVGGATHADILKNFSKQPDVATADKAAALKAFTDDKSHVFVDQTGKIYNRAEAGKIFDATQGNPPGTTTELKSQMLPSQSKALPVEIATKPPEQILGNAKQVKVSLPKGATMLRVTGDGGKVSVQSLNNVNKGDNPFYTVNVEKIEAGTIGKDKKFKPMDGGISIKSDDQIVSVPVSPQEGKVMGFGGVSKIKNSVPVATTAKALNAIQQTMTPGLNGVKSLLLPTARSGEHLHTAENLGAKIGAMNHRAEATAFGLRKDSKTFDKLGVHDETLVPANNPGIQFMSDMSQGRAMKPVMQKIADKIVKLFDDRLQKLEDAGVSLQTVRDNYFPGMWTRESREAYNAALSEAMDKGIIVRDSDVNQATPQQRAWVKARVDDLIGAGKGSENDMLGYLTRKPLKGKETFRKQKVFDDIMDAAEFGLRPVSANPIDIVKLKLAEVDKSIMANEFFNQLRSEGKLKTISPYDEVPQGWVKLNDHYGVIYGPPTVTVPEYIDKEVYDGLLDFANSLGIKHERSMKFPKGPGSRALGLSYQGQNFIRSRFATETSVIAHEIGHQLDYKYNLWKTIVEDATGTGTRGKVTKAASQKQRGKIQKELRAIADMTGNRGGYIYSAPEKIAQMVEAYVHSPEAMLREAPNVFAAFDSFVKSKPELQGLAEIKPGIELKKLTGEKYVGLPIKGYRIVPQATGDVVNNYLSSSLYNNQYFGGLYKGWMGTANALNQSQLGLGSAFHAGFTTMDVQISAGANLFKDIYGVARGNRSASDLLNTAKTFSTAAVQTGFTGDKVLNAWRNPDGVIDPRIAQVVRAAELGGGGFKMEHGLQTEQTTKLMRDWYSGKRVKAAMRSPVALTELMAKPIMEFLVPRQKAGVFAELAWRIIDQNPGKDLEELTPAFRQAWNRVDARLGQVRYNRLFLDNMAKEVMQGLVRAPGWTGGTIAEIGGAFPDAAGFVKEWADTGKLPANIPDRVAYTLSLLTTVAVVNGALTYMFTGQKPHGMDYFAFRSGKKDKDGNEQRYLLPTYMKDILAYSRQPVTTVLHKSHPLLSIVSDVYHNQDFYGYEIRDPHANKATQTGQVMKYVISQFEPFWTRGARKASQAGASAGSIAAPYVGVMPAPAYITRTPLQNEISELYHERTGERLKPYDSRATDAGKKPAHDPATMDIYMFKRLPKSDQDALRAKMSPAEQKRYGNISAQMILSE